MDRLFRQSGLTRPKWAEVHGDRTYGEMTVATAVAGCEAVYDGPANEAPDDPAAANEAPDDPHRLARRFMASLAPAGDPPRLRHWLGGWWSWESGRYRPLSDDDLRAKLTVWVRGEFVRLAADRERRKRPQKVTIALVANVAAALKSLVNVPAAVAPPAWLDGATGPDPAEAIAFPNGILEVATRQVRPNTASLFNTAVAGCEYDPAAPPPVQFEKFLSEVLFDPDAIAAAWEWLGLLLTPDTRFHKLLFLLGPRRAGKSMLLKMIVALVGAGGTAAATLAGLAEPFGLAPLLGKSVAVISEARIAARADTAAAVSRLLAVTGEDEVSVNRKNRDILTARLAVRFVMAGNELPDLPDSTVTLRRSNAMQVNKTLTTAETRCVDPFGDLRDTLPALFALGETPTTERLLD